MIFFFIKNDKGSYLTHKKYHFNDFVITYLFIVFYIFGIFVKNLVFWLATTKIQFIISMDKIG